MSDIIKILMQAEIDGGSTITNIKKQIKDIEKAIKPISIKVDEKSTRDLLKLSETIEKPKSNNLDKSLKDVEKSLARITKTFDGSGKLNKVTRDMTNELGQQVKVIEKLDSKTQDMYTSQIRVVDDLAKKERERLKVKDDMLKKLHSEALAENKLYDAQMKRAQQQKQKVELFKQDQLLRADKHIARFGKTEGISSYVRDLDKLTHTAEDADYQIKKLRSAFRQVTFDDQQIAKTKEMTEAIKHQVDMFKRQEQLKVDRHRGQYGDSEQLRAYEASLKSVGTTEENLTRVMQRKRMEFNEITTAQKIATGSTYEFGLSLKTIVRQGLAVAGIHLSLQGLFSAIRGGVQHVNDMNSALTEIAIVTNQSVDSVAHLGKEYNDLAKNMKVATTDVAEGAVLFTRQGLEQAEVMERLEATTKFAKVTNGEFAESAEFLTATVNAMNIEVDRASDTFTYLGDATATSGSEVADGFTKVSGTASAMGLEFEKVASWIAAISAKTREDAGSIGTSINMIISRMARLTEEGFDEEDGTQLNAVAKALDRIDVKLVDSENNFRNFADVIDNVAEKWDTLDEKEKSFIGNALAGARHQSKFFNLMETYSDSLNLYEGALNAAGTTQEKFDIYSQSTQASIDELKASLDGLWQSLIDDGTIQGLIKGLTKLVETINDVVDSIGGAQTIVAALGLLLGVKFKGAIGEFVGDLAKTSIVAEGAAVSMSALTGSFALANIEIIAVAAAVGALMYGLYKLVDANTEAKKSFDENMIDVGEIESDVSQLELLSDKYDELAQKQKDGIEVQKELLEVQKELADIAPSLIDYVDEEGNTYVKSTNKLKDMTLAKKELLELKLNDAESSLKSELEELNKELVKEKENAESAKKAIDELKGTSIDGAWSGAETLDAGSQGWVDELVRSSEAIEGLTGDIEEKEAALVALNDQQMKNTESIKWDTAERILNNMETATSIRELADLEQQLLDLGFTSEEVSEMRSRGLEEVKLAQEILTEAEKQEILTLESLSDTAYEYYKVRLENEKRLTTDVINHTRARIKAIQAELQALSSLTGVSVNHAQMGLKPDIEPENFVSETWSSDIFQREQNFREAEYNRVVKENQSAQRELANVEGLLDSLGSVPKSSSAVGRTGGGGGGGKNKGKGSKAKSKKEEYKAEADRYFKLNEAIEDNNRLIDHNSNLMSLHEDDYAKSIMLQEERILLLEKEQNLQHELNEERRKEKREIESQLSKFGFKFTGEGDEKKVLNPEHVKGQTKEVEELLKEHVTKRSEILGTRETWWDREVEIAKEIEDVNKKLEESTEKLKDMSDELEKVEEDLDEIEKKNAFDKFVQDLDRSMLALKPFANELDLLDDKMSLLSESDYDNRMDLLGEQYEKTQRYVRTLKDEFERLSKTKTNTADETNEIINRLTELQSQIKSNEFSMIEYQKAIDNLRVKELANDFRDLNSVLERELSLIDHNLSILEGGLLSGTDINLNSEFILPTIPENLLEKQARENMEMLEDQQDFEDKIQELKELSLRHQEEEQQRHYEESKEELLRHYSEITDKLKDFTRMQEDINRMHQDKVAGVTESGLDYVEDSHIQMWNNVMAVIQDKIASINSTLSSSRSSGGGGGGGGGGKGSGGYSHAKNYTEEEVEAMENDKNSAPDFPFDERKKRTKRYAAGTDGHDGKKKALVGEEGYELGILPSGKTVILGRHGAELVDLPKGTEVIPHQESKEVIGHTGDIDGEHIKKYAKGTGGRIRDDRMSREDLKDYWLYLTNVVTDGEEYKVLLTGEVYRNTGGDDFMHEGELSDYEWFDEGMQSILNDIATDKHPKSKTKYFDTEKSSQSNRANALGSYYMGGKDTALPDDFKEYKSNRSNSMSGIKQDQEQIIEDIADGLDVTELREELLDKIDTQLAKDVGMQHRVKLDILQQQEENSREYMNEIEEEYLQAIDDGKVDKAKELAEVYEEVSDIYLSANNKIKNAIKDRYEFEFSLIDKKIDKEREVQSFLSKEMEKHQLIDPENYSSQVVLYDGMLEKEKSIQKIREDSLEDILAQRDAIEVGSFEWNILNDKATDLKLAIEDSNIEILKLQETILNTNFNNILKDLDAILDKGSNLQYELEIKSIISPDDAKAIGKLQEDILKNTKEHSTLLYESLLELQSTQLTLDKNSQQWRIIGDQIDDVTNKIRESNLELAKQAKLMYQNKLNSMQDGILDKNQMPQQKDINNNFVDGLEKELMVKKLIRYADEHSLSLTREQETILNSSGKVRRKELDLIQKELELEQLLTREQTLRNQKTIQQLTKQEDGSWAYEYVVDSEAIKATEDEILDKQLEIERQKKDLANERENESLESAQKHYEEQMEMLDEFLKNAENRVFKSKEEFQNALESIGLDLTSEEIQSAIDDYWKYFIETAEIFINEAVAITKKAIIEQSIEFEKAGNEVGEAYTQGLLEQIDSIMDGDSDILSKQRDIAMILAGEYAEFALAGNDSGMAFIDGLIDGMATEDFEMHADEVSRHIRQKLQIISTELGIDGNVAGQAYVDGLVEGISEILESDDISNKTDAILELLNKSDEYGSLGNALGSEFIDGLANTLNGVSEEIDDEGGNTLDIALESMIGMLDEKIEEFAEKGDIQGQAYAEALQIKLIEAFQNAELSQAEIIGLLQEFEDFDLAGMLSGSSYEESLIGKFGEAEEGTDESTNQIIQGLEDEIKNFGEAGTAQGDAYANALENAFDTAKDIALRRVKEIASAVSSERMSVNIDVNVRERRVSINDVDSLGDIQRFNTGGYTGKFKGGKLGILDEKELVLNSTDTGNILQAVQYARGIPNSLNKFAESRKDLAPQIHVGEMVYPNVRDSNEIIKTIDELPNYAKQKTK